MNVIGLGTDIVNMNRVKKIYSKYGNQFLNRILTETEKKNSTIKKYCFNCKKICCKRGNF